VEEVELLQGLAVALLAAFDELPHVRGGVRTCGGLSGFFSHQ
jgi:hypothetical protein